MSASRAKRRARITAIQAHNDNVTEQWRERVDDIMKDQRISQRELARRAGLGATTVRHILKIADTTTLHTLRMIADALNVPVAYLAAGVRDKIFRSEDINDQSIRVISVWLPDDQDESGIHGVVTVLGALAHRECHALKIDDDSMRNFGSNEPAPENYILLPGDVAVFSETDQPGAGQLACVRLRNDLLGIRLLTENDEGALLATALNASFARFPIAKKDILGKVVQVVRQSS